MILDVPSPELPRGDSGLAQDLSVDRGELWPLEVWAIDIKGVFLPSVLEPEEFSAASLVLVRVDVSGDIGRWEDSDGLGNVLIHEGIGVAGRVGVVVRSGW